MPPHLAGREREQREFGRVLDQTVILENVVLTGLRGVGKTVLLERLKPIAVNQGWLGGHRSV
jgi:predicted AAA+ superfamily ATPase